MLRCMVVCSLTSAFPKRVAKNANLDVRTYNHTTLHTTRKSINIIVFLEKLYVRMF